MNYHEKDGKQKVKRLKSVINIQKYICAKKLIKEQGKTILIRKTVGMKWLVLRNLKVKTKITVEQITTMLARMLKVMSF